MGILQHGKRKLEKTETYILAKMKLLDSNIIIYSAKNEYAFLRDLFKEGNIFISDITRLEVLGFHLITVEQQDYFNSVFSLVKVIPVSMAIRDTAIALRKNYNLSVGDSIIAASTILSDMVLYINITNDFKNVRELKTYNPIKP